MSDQKVRTEITANAAQAIGEWGRFGDRVDGVARSVTGAMGNAHAMAGVLQARLVGLGATLAGGAFAAGVRRQLELMDAVSKGAQSAGVSAEAFSSMSYAARLADVSTESLTKAYTKLSGTLVDAQQGQKQAVELFRRMQLDPKQIQDADALLLALAQRFASMPDGIIKTALAVDWFGERLGPGLVPFLNQGAEGIAALREEAARLGVVVSTEAGKASEEFNDTLTRLHQRSQGLQQQLATAMLPTLQNLATALLNVDREGEVVSAMGRGLSVIFQTVSVLGANVKFVLDAMGRELGAVVAQLSLAYDVLRAPPGEIIATAKRAWAGWTAISDAVKADGVRARAELDSFERRMMGLDTGAGAGRGSINPPLVTPSGSGFTPGSKPPPAAGATPAPPSSFMSYYEALLAQEREVAAQRDALHDFSKEEELAFWRHIQAVAVLTSKDQVDILRKTSKLEVDILRDKAKQTQALDEVAWGAWRDNQLAAVAMDEEAARNQLALGVTTQEQLLLQELGFEQRRHAIRLLALQNSLANTDPARDPVQVAQINLQIEALEQQHQLKLSTLRGRAAVESRTQLTSIVTTMEQGFAGVLGRIGTSVRSMGDLIRGLGQVVLQTFVQMLAQMAAKWLVNKLLMKVISKAAALSEISADAGKAGAGGVASMAAAPFPMNLSAPFFGAAMAGAAAAFAPMASAAGGFDIPTGLNPLVQTHAREMILPATLGDTVRDMAQVYAGGRGAGGGGGGDVHFSPRGASVGDFFLVHKSDLVKALKAARRDLNF